MRSQAIAEQTSTTRATRLKGQCPTSDALKPADLLGFSLDDNANLRFTGTDDLSIDIAQQWCSDGIRR